MPVMEFRTEPHGEHEVKVYDYDAGMDNAILHVTGMDGESVAFTGLELRNLWEQYEGLYNSP